MKVSRPVRRGAVGKGSGHPRHLAGGLPYYRVTPEQLRRSLATIQVEVRYILKVLELPFEVMHQPEAMAA